MAETVRITLAAHDALVDEAQLASPDECCGLLGSRDDGRIVAVMPVTNRAADPATRFELDPAEIITARASAQRDGLEVAGFYHSHPRTSPEPSSYDVANAWYPESVYVVIGLNPRRVVRAFRIVNGRVDELEIEVEPT